MSGMGDIVGCETLLLRRERITGVERYTADTLRGDDGPYRLFLNSSSGLASEVAAFARERNWPVTTLKGNSMLSDQLELGWHLRTHVYGLAGIHHFSVAPGLLEHGLPHSITIYDVGAWRVPNTMSRGMRYLYRPLIERAMRAANLRGIVTISNFSKNEIMDVFRPDRPVSVVYPKLSDVVSVKPARVPQVQQPFFLHVGTMEPRKNLPMLLRAFRRATLRGKRLYLVGRRGWSDVKLLSENVVYLGEMTDAQLSWMYRQATAVISASHYEGFGLPVAEALALRCSVFVRDIPVYRELYASNHNCWMFRNDDELVDLLSNPPEPRDESFLLPAGNSFNEAVVRFYG